MVASPVTFTAVLVISNNLSIPIIKAIPSDGRPTWFNTIASIIKAINPENAIDDEHQKTDDVVWSKFSNKLTNYLDTVTLGSLIDEAKPKTDEIDLDELNDYYKHQN